MANVGRVVLGMAIASLLAGEARAATYYVDFAAGKDADAGSQAAPWKHCPGDPGFAGPGKLASGDTVCFKRGVTYQGKIVTMANGVTYTVTGWGSGDAVLDGSSQDACLQIHHDQISVDGGPGKNLAVTGATVKHAGIWVFAPTGPLSGATLKNLKVSAIGNPSSVEGIGIKLTGNPQGVTDCTISGCEIKGCFSAGIKVSGDGTSGVDIHDNLLEGNGALPNERCQVNLSSNAGAGVQNVDFHHNVLRAAGALANGINCNNANNTIRNNTIAENPGSGILLSPTYNTSYAGPLKVYANVIRDNAGYGISVGPSDESRHAVIHNNVLANNGSVELNLIGGASHTKIYNNTIYHHEGSAGHGLRVQAGSAEVTVRNNIISVADGYALYDSTGAVKEDHNDLHRPSGSPVAWADQPYSSLAAYQSASKQGAGSISTAPLFVDAQTFRLSVGSPCIDAGAPLADLFALDLAGTSRPQGAGWDLGALEHTTATPGREGGARDGDAGLAADGGRSDGATAGDRGAGSGPGGCSCRLCERRGRGPGAAALAALLLALLRRRRRGTPP